MAKFYGEKAPYLLRLRRNNEWLGTAARLAIVLIAGFAGGFLINRLPKELVAGGKFILFIAFFVIISGILYVLLKVIKHANIQAMHMQRRLSGEGVVAEELHRLPHDYVVCQDVRVPRRGGSFHFVIIGPTGMYGVMVKSQKGQYDRHSMTLVRNGQSYPGSNSITKAIDDADSLHNWLKVHGIDTYVGALLVFSDSEGTISQELCHTPGIHVVHRTELMEFLLTSNALLSADFTSAEIASIMQELHN